jgi:Tetratricopeptide repeat
MNAEKKTANETVLAHQLKGALEGIKHGPSRGTVYTILGVAAVLLIGGLFRYFYTSSQAATSERWVKFDEVVFPEQLELLEAEPGFKDSPQGRLLRFKQARQKLAQGLSNLASQPDLGQKDIEKGTEIYESLAKSAGRIPLLHQEALWGTAKGHESLGHLDEARTYYTRLVKEYPASALGKDAAKQLVRLDKDAKNAEELAKMLLPASGK